MNDLILVLKRGYESKELDYKGPCAWDESNKKACCEIVKDILAMANTLGGWLIFGVNETDEGFGFNGMKPEQIKSFETSRINRFLQNYADPPINTSLKKIQYEDNNYVIITIPRFKDTPHICQKDYPDVLQSPAIYVRTDNNESAPLKSSSDFRNIIENAIRNRTDALLNSFRNILKHGEVKISESDEEKFRVQLEEARVRCDELNPHINKGYAYLETVFYTETFVDNRFSFKELREMAENACIDYTGWPFIFISKSRPDFTYNVSDGIETLIDSPDPFSGKDDLHFWQFRKSGLMYIKEILHEEKSSTIDEKTKILWYEITSMTVGKMLDCLCRLYDGKVSEDEQITLVYRLNEMKERVLIPSYREIRFRKKYISKVSIIEGKLQKKFIEWKSGLIDNALEICSNIFRLFNMDKPNLHLSKTKIEKMFERTYPKP